LDRLSAPQFSARVSRAVETSDHLLHPLGACSDRRTPAALRHRNQFSQISTALFAGRVTSMRHCRRRDGTQVKQIDTLDHADFVRERDRARVHLFDVAFLAVARQIMLLNDWESIAHSLASVADLLGFSARSAFSRCPQPVRLQCSEWRGSASVIKIQKLQGRFEGDALS
jgi:hypothetical protein